MIMGEVIAAEDDMHFITTSGQSISMTGATLDVFAFMDAHQTPLVDPSHASRARTVQVNLRKSKLPIIMVVK